MADQGQPEEMTESVEEAKQADHVEYLIDMLFHPDLHVRGSGGGAGGGPGPPGRGTPDPGAAGSLCGCRLGRREALGKIRDPRATEP